MTDVWDSYLRPPCRRDDRVEVANPEGMVLRVAVRAGLDRIQEMLATPGPDGEHYRRLIWLAAVESRRADGHGYVMHHSQRLWWTTNDLDDPDASIPLYLEVDWVDLVDETTYVHEDGQVQRPRLGRRLAYGPGWTRQR